MSGAEQEVDCSPLADRWVASGAAALTGRADGPPLVPPAAVVGRVVELGDLAHTDGLAVLGERAACAGLTRQGDRSCGGASRLLRARDGWMALTLARDDDVVLVPAWLEVTDVGDPWCAVEAALESRSGEELVERARMLGLPVAMVGSAAPPRSAPEAAAPEALAGLARLPVVATAHPAGPRGHEARQSPLVVDLSSLWAGPLCAQLLGGAGAQVVKVEAAHRPDGARQGPAAFFDRLHRGHRSVVLDFRSREGVESLARLIHAADVVIEASRPRALAQLGLAAEDLLAGDRGPRAWISITGYGRTGPERDWVAFGDDAAAAGGLVAWDQAGPCFFADAVADPLAGMTAAAAALAVLEAGEAGGSWLIDVAMAGVAAYVAGPDPRGQTWLSATEATPPSPPPPPTRRGPELGEHTSEVLGELSLSLRRA